MMDAGTNNSAPVAQIRSPVRMPPLYPTLSINHPAGNAPRKYPPKKATWINDDWKSVSLNAFLKWGIRTSLRLTPIAHRKNRLVTRMNGSQYRLSVNGADDFMVK